MGIVKRFRIMLILALMLFLVPFIYKAPYVVMVDPENEDESSTSDNSSESHDEYSSATSTSAFILPAATWVTPECVHGQPALVVLPLMNMFKYDVKDVVVTPVLSAKTGEFPFEIDATGFTQKIDYLVGEDKIPNRNERAQNCVWLFRTREDVKTGYYKIDYNITYTNPACVIESCTVSTYVKTIGLPENGTTDGVDENRKISTPRLMVKGFYTEPAEVYAGEDFMLHLTVENTSRDTPVSNIALELTGIVAGTTEASSYAAFLPSSGSDSVFIDKISPGGEYEVVMEFNAKADLQQKPYTMNIAMKYEDAQANPYEGSGSVSIPIRQYAKYDTSNIDVEPAEIEVGENADIMFSVYNTGKTQLYNVSVSINDASLEEAFTYLGSLAPGATGNVDLLVNAVAPSEGDGTVQCYISYEDENGNVTTGSKDFTLFVTEAVPEDYGETEPLEETEERPKWFIPVLTAVGVVVILVVIIGIIVAKKKKKRRQEELAAIEEEEAALEEDLGR
ncbi:MAG: hypothetical protein K5985_05260 [Lachnospiraceae bacterium]|nr:hypothetical protein [Lachnospiraceae bacterium]